MVSQAHDNVSKADRKTGDQKKVMRALTIAFMVLLIISCNLPFLGQSASTPTATVSAVPTKTPTIPAASTPTQVLPSLMVDAETPCLTGPGDLYELVVSLQPGEKAEIIGRAEGFWIVKTANGSECWVIGQSVTTEGEVASVPSVEPPPTPAPAAPAPPVSLQAIGAVCSVDPVTKKVINQFHLAWQDMSNNETGFRVYRDGNRIAEVVADRTDVVDEIIANNNRTHVYYVIAFNEVGESKSEPIALTCEGGGGGGGGGPGPGPGP